MCACLVITVFYTVAWDVLRSYPYAIEYEGHIFWASHSLSLGKNIYDAAMLSNQNWGVIIYNPLYIALGACLVKFVGLSYEPLRLLTMTSTLAVFVGFLVVMVNQFKLRHFHSIIALSLLASSLPVFYWSGVARVDMLGLALSVWGTERFLSAWNKRLDTSASNPNWNWALAVSVILFVAAFFTKQQYFVFPLSISVYCFLKAQKKLGTVFLLSWAVSIALIVMLIQQISGGYLAHLSYASGLPWEWRTMKQFLLPFLLDYKTIASLIVIVLGGFVSKPKHPQETLARVLVLISFTLCMYTMGLRAAYHNHLLCTEIALYWLAVINLGKLSGGPSMMVILALLFSLNNMQIYFAVLWERLNILPETRQSLKLLEAKKLAGKHILSEDPTLPMLIGATPSMIDGTTILNMSAKHPEQIAALKSAIEAKRFDAIMINTADAEKLKQEIWPEPLVRLIKRKYRLAGRSGGNGLPQSVYVPVY
jgi:hypothetical protein